MSITKLGDGSTQRTWAAAPAQGGRWCRCRGVCVAGAGNTAGADHGEDNSHSDRHPSARVARPVSRSSFLGLRWRIGAQFPLRMNVNPTKRLSFQQLWSPHRADQPAQRHLKDISRVGSKVPRVKKPRSKWADLGTTRRTASPAAAFVSQPMQSSCRHRRSVRPAASTVNGFTQQHLEPQRHLQHVRDQSAPLGKPPYRAAGHTGRDWIAGR